MLINIYNLLAERETLRVSFCYCYLLIFRKKKQVKKLCKLKDTILFVPTKKDSILYHLCYCYKLYISFVVCYFVNYLLEFLKRSSLHDDEMKD